MIRWYSDARRGIAETDASLYISNADLQGLDPTERINSGLDIPALPEVGLNIEDPPPVQASERSGLLRASFNGESQQHLEPQDVDSCWSTMQQIVERCLQPPVVGAVLGLLVAATPLRGIFVDLVHRSDDAPLEWFFALCHST